VLRPQRKPGAGRPQPLRSLARVAESSYRRRINWEREIFMASLHAALRGCSALVIAAAFCLGTPGAWAQTAPTGASTTAPAATETQAEKKKAEEKAAKAQEEQEKKSKEETAKEEKAKEEKTGKTETASGSTSTTPETKTATESKTEAAPKTAQASGKPAAGFGSEAEAKASCPMDTVVWENTSSKVYHVANSKYYGKTKHGAYACSKAAGAAGFKAASN